MLANGSRNEQPFPLTNKLISHEGFKLHSWDDPYAKGVWVCISNNEESIRAFEQASDASTLDTLLKIDEMNEIDWLPIAIGCDFTDALWSLEQKLADMPDDYIKKGTVWGDRVTAALLSVA